MNADLVNSMIEAWTSELSSAQVIEELATKRGVPTVPVRTAAEVIADPHLRATGAIQPLVHPDAGEIEAAGAGIPIRMSGSTVGLDRPAPKLGGDNAAVYGGLLGLADEEIDRLRADGVI